MPDLPPGAIVLCTLSRYPADKEHAALLRTLFNRLADDRPHGRRQGPQHLRAGDQRHVTVGGARAGRVRNIIQTLAANGTLTVEVNGP